MERTVLITGASAGLGRALARALGASGARIVGVARGRAALEDALAGLPTAWAVTGDVGDPEDAARIVGEATALAGPIDVLINNASTLGPTPLLPLVDLTPAEVDRVFQVNVLGPLRLIRLVAGEMSLRGGTILNVSSDAAVAAYPTWGAYGAAKAALDHATRTLAAELDGVRVLAVDPGEMDTAMHRDAIPDADPATLARPEAVAGAIVAWLATEPPSGTRWVRS